VSAPDGRGPAQIRTDIADLQRLMVDVPPHHGSGTRRALEERLEDLQRELRRAERPDPARASGATGTDPTVAGAER
jgi:hypothetical protein